MVTEAYAVRVLHFLKSNTYISTRLQCPNRGSEMLKARRRGTGRERMMMMITMGRKGWGNKHVALDDDGAPDLNVVVDFKVSIDGQLAKYLDLSSAIGSEIVSKCWNLSTLLPIGKQENGVSGRKGDNWSHIPAADVACNVHVAKALDLVPKIVC